MELFVTGARWRRCLSSDATCRHQVRRRGEFFFYRPVWKLIQGRFARSEISCHPRIRIHLRRQCHGAMILPLRAVIYGVAPVAFPRHAGGAHTGHNGK